MYQLKIFDEPINPCLSRIITDKEKLIIGAYASLIPYSHQERPHHDHRHGYSRVDLETIGCIVEGKNASAETRTNDGFAQLIKNAAMEKEKAKWEGREPKTSALLLFNHKGTNKKRKKPVPSSACSWLPEMQKLMPKDLKIIILYESALTPLEDRKRNAGIIRGIDRQEIIRWPEDNDFLEGYNRQCLDIDWEVWG